MARPDRVFTDGFDKYGQVSSALAQALLALVGGYTAATVTSCQMVAALVGEGQAVTCTSSGGNSVRKTFASNYQRSTGSIWCKSSRSQQQSPVQLFDSSTLQCQITLETTGAITVRRGTTSLAATAIDAFLANEVFCLQYDITVHNSTGTVKVWKDGVELTALTLTGQDTASTANNYCNGIGWTLSTGGVLDHMYHGLYTTSGGTETPPLDGGRITTQRASAVSSAVSTIGQEALGSSDYLTTTSNLTAGRMYLRRVLAADSGNLNSLQLTLNGTNVAAKLKACVYDDVAGVPTNRLATGTEVVGYSPSVNLPLSAALAITEGTYYWIGFHTDTNGTGDNRQADATTDGRYFTQAYASGVPATAGALTNFAPPALYGLVTGVTDQAQVVNDPVPTTNAYTVMSAVNDEDLYSFPALDVDPDNIYCVAIHASVLKTDAGARTIDLRSRSGATTSSGQDTGITPSTSQSWASSWWQTDPNGGGALTKAVVDAMTGGEKVVT